MSGDTRCGLDRGSRAWDAWVGVQGGVQERKVVPRGRSVDPQAGPACMRAGGRHVLQRTEERQAGRSSWLVGGLPGRPEGAGVPLWRTGAPG